MRNERPPTDPQRLTRLFRYAMDAQGVAVDDERLAGWCAFVSESMSGHGRDYHRIDHVFDVADGANPVQILAGLFHDVVYVQADGSLPDQQMTLLSDVVELNPDGIALLPHKAKPERLRAMLEILFDIEPGRVLSPIGGLNEFLSALLAVRHLEQALPITTLLQLGACIELTIPFRGPDAKGRIPAEALFQRVAAVNAEFRLEMDTDDLHQTIHPSVGARTSERNTIRPETVAARRLHIRPGWRRRYRQSGRKGDPSHGRSERPTLVTRAAARPAGGHSLGLRQHRSYPEGGTV